LAIAAQQPAAAATVTWQGPNLGAWTENSNWNTGTAPTADDDVILATTGVTIDINGASLEAKSLTITAGGLRITAYVPHQRRAIKAPSEFKLRALLNSFQLKNLMHSTAAFNL
jgi:hypothetical protein